MLKPRKPILRALGSWLTAFALLLIPQPVQATLYVIILDRQEIAIASDGKRAFYLRGELSLVSKTTEKVTKLGSKLAFMCSGLVEITTAKVTIRPSEIARSVYVKQAAEDASLLPMNELANKFGKTTTDQLDGLTREGKNQMLALKGQLDGQAPQIFECIFVGLARWRWRAEN